MIKRAASKAVKTKTSYIPDTNIYCDYAEDLQEVVDIIKERGIHLVLSAHGISTAVRPIARQGRNFSAEGSIHPWALKE